MVHVPQYNPQVVYTQPATTTTIVVQDADDDQAAAAVIGFAAGIAIGAAVNETFVGKGEFADHPRLAARQRGGSTAGTSRR